MSKDKFLCTTQSIWLINYKVYHSKEYGVAKYILTYLKSFTTLWSKRILVKLFVKNCSFTIKKKKTQGDSFDVVAWDVEFKLACLLKFQKHINQIVINTFFTSFG